MDCYDENSKMADGEFLVTVETTDNFNRGEDHFVKNLSGTGSYDTNIAYCEFNYATVIKTVGK